MSPLPAPTSALLLLGRRTALVGWWPLFAWRRVTALLLLFLLAEQLATFMRMICAPLRAVARRHAWLRTGLVAFGSGLRTVLTLRRRAVTLPLRGTIGLPVRALSA